MLHRIIEAFYQTDLQSGYIHTGDLGRCELWLRESGISGAALGGWVRTPATFTMVTGHGRQLLFAAL